MQQKKWLLFCLCMSMLYSRGLAQSVTWASGTGAVQVAGGTKTFSTYVALTEADVEKWMTHLNMANLFAEFPGKGGITATMGTGGSVEFRVYAYDKTTHTKGAQLYGCKSDQSGFHENPLADEPAIVWSEDISIHLHVHSTKIKSIIQKLPIYIGANECAFSDDSRKAILWAFAKSGIYNRNQTMKNAAKALVAGAGLAKIDFEMISALKTSAHYAAKDVINALASNCHKHATSLQPVIVELKVTNATVTQLDLPALNGSITPQEIFHISNNTDYSNLFKHDRTTVLAHRGYWRNAGVAQNSKAAVQAAQDRHDIDAFEIDVRSTSDKKAICFHDDKPQKILRAIGATYPHASVYDLSLTTLQSYKLHDRFDSATSEYLSSLKHVFEYIKNNNITKPINLDIGIPDHVPQGGSSVPGRPFFDAVFLEAVALACQNGLTGQIMFKGKYTYDDSIWNAVKDTLSHYPIEVGSNGFAVYPIIAYTPKLGDEIHEYESYRDNWLDLNKGRGIPHVAVVGMEVRLKNYNTSGGNTPVVEFLKATIPIVKNNYYNENVPLRVGVFSETPTTCQGYWTKSAAEHYVDFTEDHRNNFDWVLNNGYDYIITDTPEILKMIINARQ